MSTKKKKAETRGRPKTPQREIVGTYLPMPPSIRDRLRKQASNETVKHPLGLVVSARELAVRLIVEGLARLETPANPAG